MESQNKLQSVPTAKPVIAGIFNIITGVGLLLLLIILSIGGLIIGSFTFPFISLIIPILGIPGLALGILCVIGGIFAIQRRHWGWAIAGSIAAALASNVLGVVAIILIALSREEFKPG